jgi:hypothetical protein
VSKLYAQIEPDTGASPAHRPSNKTENVWVQTELGRIEVHLRANGEVYVWWNAVRSHEAVLLSKLLLIGNVNECEFMAQADAGVGLAS